MKPGCPAQIRAAGRDRRRIRRQNRALGGRRSIRRRAPCGSRSTCRIANNALVPGMYVTVAFQLPPSGQVEVPAAALIFRAGGTQVARVAMRRQGRSSSMSTIARDDGSQVELGPGVSPGDRLVLNISSQIGAGQTVAVSNPSLAWPTMPRRRRVEDAVMRAQRALRRQNASGGIARLAVMCIIAGLTACAVGPNYRTPDTELAGRVLGERRHRRRRPRATIVPGPSADLAAWWRALGDAELNSLVDRAVKSNLDVGHRADRLQQARTYEAVVAGSCAAGGGCHGRGRPAAREPISTRGRAEQASVSADNTNGLSAHQYARRVSTPSGSSISSANFAGRFEAARFDAQAAAAARIRRAHVGRRRRRARLRRPARISSAISASCVRRAMCCANRCAS